MRLDYTLAENNVITILTDYSLGLRLKRTMDAAVSPVVLILISPIFVITALLIKWTSSGSAFHLHKRTGLNRHPFMMWKFRTMIPGADQYQPALDELPQLAEGDPAYLGRRPVSCLREEAEGIE